MPAQRGRDLSYGIGVHVATSGRDTDDILTNVLVSACYGFALAAFQFRFAWIWPLILLHALADFTTILTSGGLGDLMVGVMLVVFVGFGIIVIRGRPRTGAARAGPVAVSTVTIATWCSCRPA